MQLYPHQKEALELIKDKKRCAIYYDMGLGKTFIGSEKLADLKAKANLVVCQKSKIDDWVKHFETYYPDDFVLNLSKPQDMGIFLSVCLDDEMLKACQNTQVVGVINYDLIWRRKELLGLRDFTLMLDESSLITNRTANRSSFILKFNPENVILLSGTPTAGKYENLWSQLVLLGWDIPEDRYFKSYVDYQWTETSTGYWDKKIIGYKNIDHLKRRLAKFGAIFKKTADVIDLPEQIEQIIELEPSKNYKKFVKNHYLEIYQGPDKDPIELLGDTVLTRILYERTLCGQYSLDKLEAFKDLLESTEDRLIVFYNFNEELSRMHNILNEMGRPFCVVNGQVKDLYAYEHSNNSVTFIQYQAGAYGLNLQKANKIIYFTLPLGIGSCDLWEQSKKRIHRIGQDRTCFYYYLITKNSIEDWNLGLLRKGKELTDDLFKHAENQ